MHKYIDADVLKRKLRDTYSKWSGSLDCVDSVIDDMPAADVEPVRHGKWVKMLRFDDVPVRCSVCEFATYEPLNYCPHCGAKLDGGSEE